MNLNLVASESVYRKPSLWKRWVPFRGDLQMRENSWGEISQKAKDLAGMHRRYGSQRAWEFIEGQLLPAVRKHFPQPEAWRCYYETGCRTLVSYIHHGSMPPALALAGRLIRDLPHSCFSKDTKEHIKLRAQSRQFLSQQLRQMALFFTGHGQKRQALEAYRALIDWGIAVAEDKSSYWQLQKEVLSGVNRVPQEENIVDPRQVVSQIRLLGEGSWREKGDIKTETMKGRIESFLHIEENLPEEELRRKIHFNYYGMSGPHPYPKAAYHIGLGYLCLGDTERAIRYLRRAAPHSDLSPGSLPFYLGKALAQNGSYQEAWPMLEEAREQGFSPQRIDTWLGYAYARSDRWDKAISLLDPKSKLPAEFVDKDFFLQWGYQCFSIHRTEDAEKLFLKALEHEEGFRAASFAYTVCLVAANRMQEAVDHLQTLWRKDPDFAAAPYLLGRIYQLHGHGIAAIANYREAHSLNPQDPWYCLSLGSALYDEGQAEALPLLVLAAEAGVGGKELFRRLTFSYIRSGHITHARKWIARWAETESSDIVTRLLARDSLSQAIEAFNRRSFAESIALWRKAIADFPQGEGLPRNLAAALLWQAYEQLKVKLTEEAWEQIREADELCPSDDSFLLLSFELLLRGQYDSARQAFGDLRQRRPDLTICNLFEHLAAYCGGEEEKLEALSTLLPPEASVATVPFIRLIQIRRHAVQNEFPQAFEKVKELLGDIPSLLSLGLTPYLLNAFLAHIAVKTPRALNRFPQTLRNLKTTGKGLQDDFWMLAETLGTHKALVNQKEGKEDLVETESLEACRHRYERLIESGMKRGMEDKEQQLLQRNYFALLQFMICHFVKKCDFVKAQELVRILMENQSNVSESILRLEEMLRVEMDRPSHEKAYALLEKQPQDAEKVWELLRQQDPSDLIALQHLACCAWNRAYEDVIAGKIVESLIHWEKGLEYYRQLYSDMQFWEGMEAKGRMLGHTVHPFEDTEFSRWRNQAILEMARIPLNLAFHVLGGCDFTNPKKDQQSKSIAKSILNLLQNSKLDQKIKSILRDLFAEHYLDPDPTQLPQFDLALGRAEAVLQLDPKNVKTLLFLLRAISYRFNEPDGQQKRVLADRVKKARCYADSLEEEWILSMKNSNPSITDLNSIQNDLADYYEALANAYQNGAARRDAVDIINTGRLTNLKKSCETVIDEDKAAISAIQKSNGFRLNLQAAQSIQEIEKEIQTCRSILNQLAVM